MKMTHTDLKYEIYKIDPSLKIKDIEHFLKVREEAIIKILKEGNSLKDGKLVTYSFEDKEPRKHHNGFSKDDNDIITLPARRVFHVDYLPKIKSELNRPLEK